MIDLGHVTNSQLASFLLMADLNFLNKVEILYENFDSETCMDDVINALGKDHPKLSEFYSAREFLKKIVAEIQLRLGREALPIEYAKLLYADPYHRRLPFLN